MSTYAEFLARKAARAPHVGISVERIVWSASCAACGWHRNYATSSSASRGQRRHRCSDVRRPRATKPQEVRYNDGLYGGRWVLDPVRRVMVWEQQW